MFILLYRMVYKKRTYGRKKRYVKKRRTTKGVARNSAYKIKSHKFNYETGILNTRITTTSTVSVAAGAAINTVYSPSLSNLPAAELAAYQALYDMFRLKAIKVTFRPRGNIANVGAAGSFRLYSVIDPTDGVSLATTAEALEYRNCKSTIMSSPHSRYCKLMMPTLLLDTNANPVLQAQWPLWLQTNPQNIASVPYNDTIVAHRGIKFISETATSAQNFDVTITLYVQFKLRR